MGPIKGVQSISSSVVTLGHPVRIQLLVTGKGASAVSVSPVTSHRSLAVYTHSMSHTNEGWVWHTQVVPLDTGWVTIPTRDMLVNGVVRWHVPAQAIRVEPPVGLPMMTPPLIDWFPVPFPTWEILIVLLGGLGVWGTWLIRKRFRLVQLDSLNDPEHPPVVPLFALMDALSIGYAHDQRGEFFDPKRWRELWFDLMNEWYQVSRYDTLDDWHRVLAHRIHETRWHDIQTIQMVLDNLVWGPSMNHDDERKLVMVIRGILYRWSQDL